VTNNRHLALAGRLNQPGRPLLNIDELGSTFPEENVGLSVSPDAPAYILYTSGSTGRPKGVVQCHRNVLWDVREYTNTLYIRPDDRMTVLYSCSVNGAVRGIFGALLNGAALYPLDIKEEGLNGLADLLSREEITFYYSVPTVFRHFVGTLNGRERFPKLRVVRLGGERVLARDVESYRKHFPDECLLYTGHVRPRGQLSSRRAAADLRLGAPPPRARSASASAKVVPVVSGQKMYASSVMLCLAEWMLA